MSELNSSVTAVNTATTEVVNGLLIETNPANWPTIFGGLYNAPGSQTTPGLARGALANTGILYSNSNLAHVCDFKFDFSAGISIESIINPLLAIENAIKNGKLAAANIMRAAVMQLQQGFNLAISALLNILNLSDLSGQVSISISIGFDILNRINEIIAQAAQIAYDVSLIANLIQDLTQIVNWINSLPAQLKAVVQECLGNFQNSINHAVNAAEGVQGVIQGINSAVGLAQATSQSTNNGALMQVIGGSTSQQSLTMLSAYITSSTPTANSVAANTTSSQLGNSTGP